MVDSAPKSAADLHFPRKMTDPQATPTPDPTPDSIAADPLTQAQAELAELKAKST